MTSHVSKTSSSASVTAPRRRDVHSLRKRATGALAQRKRTYQPVRGGSRYIGEQEDGLWRQHNRFDRADNNAWLRSAEHIGRTTKKPGKRKGALGYVELAVLRLFLRLRGRADGRLDPSMTWIAAELRLSRSAVEEGLARLEAAGFFHRINRCEPVEDPQPGGQYVKQATNAYVLKLRGMALRLVHALLRRPLPKDEAPARAEVRRRKMVDRVSDELSWTPADQAAFVAQLTREGAIPSGSLNSAMQV